MYLLPSCLIAAVGFAGVLRNPRMAGTAIILFANWAINTAVCEWAGQHYPWPWFLSIDYLSGLVVLFVAGKPTLWQAIVTALFALECVAHGAFGLTRITPWTEYYYWYSLHYIAWSQFWIVTGWGLYDLARRGFRHDRRAPPSLADMERHQAPRAKP